MGTNSALKATGSGGDAVVVSTKRVFVDADNGADAVSNGTIDAPYATLSYAASQQAEPTSLSEYSEEIIFHLEPGTYSGNVTLPHRSNVTITGELVQITGDINWYQDPDVFFGHAGGDRGVAALSITGANGNPIRVTGDITAQNENPSVTVAVGDKFFIARDLIVSGSFMNLNSGASSSANEATGPVHCIWDRVEFTSATDAIFGEGEASSYGKNQIYLHARDCTLISVICGNIELHDLNSCVIDEVDYTTGRPAGVALTTYNGNVGGSTYIGAVGLIDCIAYSSLVSSFDFGKHASNAYTVNRLSIDPLTNASIAALSTWTNFSGAAAPDNDIVIDATSALIIGDGATEGDWRIIRSGNDLVIQRLESSTWTTKDTISA